MKNILRTLLVLALACISHVAAAQTPVYQTGIVTNGHPVGWASNRFVADLETLGGYSQLTITNPLPTFCINDSITANPYHQLCLGANNTAGTGGTATYNAFGGAASLPFIIAANTGQVSFNGSALTLGVSGSSAGSLIVSGGSSGAVTIKTVASAGTWNFNLPVTAGTINQPLISQGGGTSAMAWGSLSGNTSTFVTLSGGTTVNHCTQFDASGNLVDSGSSCASSGVGSGVAGNLPYYAVSGSTVVGNVNLNISNSALTIGVASSSTGSLNLTGASGGVITIQPGNATAGTWNLNLPNTAGLAGQVLTSGGGGAGTATWSNPSPVCCTYKNANFNAVASTGYCVDTSAGPITMTVEAFPTNGDAYIIMDCDNTFATNNLTIARNGNLIMNLAQNMTVSTLNANFILQWDTHFSNWVAR